MSMLALAVEIANVIATADQKQFPLDAETAADRLDEAHPEAEATREQILDVLVEEGAAVGVVIDNDTTVVLK